MPVDGQGRVEGDEVELRGDGGEPERRRERELQGDTGCVGVQSSTHASLRTVRYCGVAERVGYTTLDARSVLGWNVDESAMNRRTSIVVEVTSGDASARERLVS